MTPLVQEKSPLKRFVLFIVCLALVGCLVAGAWVYAIEQPGRNQVQPPVNTGPCMRDSCNGAPTCGPHYDPEGNLIGYQCCDRDGTPVSCSSGWNRELM